MRSAHSVAAREAAAWINSGNTKEITATPFHFTAGYELQTGNVFEGADIILDCLPGSQAPRIGMIARKNSSHYANLTEYVNETNQLKEIAKGAPTGFILQTGLAPGFVNVLGNSLYKDFVKTYENQQVEYLGMKVGALTKNAEAPHFYGFTWSPVGVATEYLKDSWVIDDFKRRSVPALSAQSALFINGIGYEENFTSGGAADLPEAFEGLARKLDYKTLRYPGHYDWIKAILKQAPKTDDPVQYLEQQMRSVIPSIEDDQVIIYATVRGFDKEGILRGMEKSLRINPIKAGKVTLRAIQATTAASLAECAQMLLGGNLQGAVMQSQISPFEFMNGTFVKQVYFSEEKANSQDMAITIAA